MNKKTKIIIIITIAILLMIALYFTVFHPRFMVFQQMMYVYDEMGGNTDIGLPIVEYDQYSVSDASLVMTDLGAFSIGLPSDWEDQSKDSSEIRIYRTMGAVVEPGVNNPENEGLAISPVGDDNSDMVVLNRELIDSPIKLNQLKKGYEQLGYDMPDDFYHTLKCAHSLEKDDYSFWNYNKGLAFTYALPLRAGSLFYSNGDTAKTYFYETDDMCGIICEQYLENYNGNYHFQLDFYDSDDLNTGYVFSMTVHDKETGYAIINSLTFDE